MLSSSPKCFKAMNMVAVPIPAVDKGRAEFPNVMGVITSVSNDGMYQIGTGHGTLKQKYMRAEFIPAKTSFLEVGAVLKNEITLRAAARKNSMCGGQEYRYFNCMNGSNTNMCSCHKTNRLCNSKCHSSLSCKNK